MTGKPRPIEYVDLTRYSRVAMKMAGVTEDDLWHARAKFEPLILRRNFYIYLMIYAALKEGVPVEDLSTEGWVPVGTAALWRLKSNWEFEIHTLPPWISATISMFEQCRVSGAVAVHPDCAANFMRAVSINPDHQTGT